MPYRSNNENGFLTVIVMIRVITFPSLWLSVILAPGLALSVLPKIASEHPCNVLHFLTPRVPKQWIRNINVAVL